MNSFQIRKKFLDFFAKNGHTSVSSSSLIPAEDPTLLFTNAGMNQFKDLFLGKEKRSYTRATSSQKCVRAGGKHNDLDQVGFTERHLTFFEMLGNFSFGDYFKKEAIQFAWDFLTIDMNLPAEKLYVTVFTTDDQAYDLWHKMIGIPAERISRLGEKDNFWQMGDTGPCGPCTEIYVDRGATRGCGSASCAPGCDCSRYTEIWNLVFMQYDRQANGELAPLKATGVDTGMGLERLCMVTENKDTIFHAEPFAALLKEIEVSTGISYAKSDANTQAAFHVLSDHVRSSSLLIADGCSPANEGRGYVLRKIIRRAALFAQKLSTDQKLFSKLSQTLISELGKVYPELETNKNLIIKVLDSEIERFAQNLVQGQHILEKYIQEAVQIKTGKLSGEQVFKLYDTYGFPPELTHLMAREKSFDIDMSGFEEEMKKQQAQSGKKNKEAQAPLIVAENVSTNFVGYQTLENKSKIICVNKLDDHAWIITEESPFYVESGGQVNDQGTVTINQATYPVTDLKKLGDTHKPAIAIKISLKPTSGSIGEINVGDSAHSVVDAQTRWNTVRNHTATHMLQAALIQLLGKTVKQAGSVVNDTYLRYDFTHHEALSKEQIETVENMVNQKIWENISTVISNTTLEDAKTKGVISFFGEKYNPENVRVVQIPGFSAELCGGTHAPATGIIGCFKITSESALSTGTRRIVAVTGPEALKVLQQSFGTIKKLSEEFSAKPEEVLTAVQKHQANYLEALSTIKQLKKQSLKSQIPAWQQQIALTGSVPFLFLELEDIGGEELKTICQELEKSKPGFFFVVSKQHDAGQAKFAFLGYLSKNLEKSVDLKAFGEMLKTSFNLRGGGSATFIQGGGTSVPAALKQTMTDWVKSL